MCVVFTGSANIPSVCQPLRITFTLHTQQWFVTFPRVPHSSVCRRASSGLPLLTSHLFFSLRFLFYLLEHFTFGTSLRGIISTATYFDIQINLFLPRRFSGTLRTAFHVLSTKNPELFTSSVKPFKHLYSPWHGKNHCFLTFWLQLLLEAVNRPYRCLTVTATFVNWPLGVACLKTWVMSD